MDGQDQIVIANARIVAPCLNIWDDADVLAFMQAWSAMRGLVDMNYEMGHELDRPATLCEYWSDRLWAQVKALPEPPGGLH